MRWWKILGLAGFAGVAATGVVIARAERARRAYTPDEIRDQLHARLAVAGAGAGADGTTGTGAEVNGTARRAEGPGRATAPGGWRLPGWWHGPRRPPRHRPRLRPHRRPVP
jgi:hypothetical protein